MHEQISRTIPPLFILLVSIALYPVSFITKRDGLIVVVGLASAALAVATFAVLTILIPPRRSRLSVILIGAYILIGIALLPASVVTFERALDNDHVPWFAVPVLIVAWPQYWLFLLYWALTGGSAARYD